VKKIYLLICFGLVAVFLVLFLAGTPALSVALKAYLIPELKDLLGEDVTVDDITLDLFPLAVEADAIAVSDGAAGHIVSVERAKAYLGLGGVFTRTVYLHRLVLRGASVTAEREKIEEMITHVKAYLQRERKGVWKVKIKAVEVTSGTVKIHDSALRADIAVDGLSGELITGERPRLKASAENVVIDRQNWPQIACDVTVAVVLSDNGIDVKKLRVGAFGSDLAGEGVYAKGRGRFETRMSVLMDSVKRFLGLKEKGDGRITATGTIRFEKGGRALPEFRSERGMPSPEIGKVGVGFPRPDEISVHLELDGNFYLETLMELLKVRERVEGFVQFDGEINGPLSDINGKARARLRKGNLFTVDVDSLQCVITYRKGVMHFSDGSAVLYGGTARADAFIHLPVVDEFSVNVSAQSVNSSGVFQLIRWDPGIPEGKVDGELSTAGRSFSPEGWFAYRNPHSGTAQPRNRSRPGNVLDRITDITGRYALRGSDLSLVNLALATPQSRGSGDGVIDLSRKTLDLKVKLATENVRDLSMPYYSGAEGSALFSGGVSGSLSHPIITGRIAVANPSVEGYRAQGFTADVSYQKDLLTVRDAVVSAPGEEHRIKGRILFPEAVDLFDVADPVYELAATIRRAKFGEAVKVFAGDIMASGLLSADVKIEGRGRGITVTGTASVENGSVYSLPFDSASGGVRYAHGEFSLTRARIARGQSSIAADGTIDVRKAFSVRATSERVFLKDMGLRGMPDDALMSVKCEGSGTFDNPSLAIDAIIAGGTFKGKDMGTGTIHGEVRNREITVRGALFGEKMKLDGQGYLDERLPWSARLVIQPSRYDFIASALLKDVPEDLHLNLEGKIDMKGDWKTFEASANINRLSLLLFGQSFSNDSEVRFSVRNRRVELPRFSIRSGDMAFRVAGTVEMGREYDLQLDGRSTLSPLKGLSRKIGYLKGDTDFVFVVRGKWDKPDVKGGMTISDGSFGLRGYAAYMSGINGYLYVDEDRIVIEKLTGRFGGGTASITGLAYLTGFAVRRFHLDMRLDDITVKISPEFSVNFSGNLLSRGTPDAMQVTGDIRINRARYREPVEWRGWLLAARAIEKPKAEASLFERAELNIQISGSENITVDNNIARAPVRIRGDMLVKGTLGNPILFGRLESKEGYIYFRNNEFRIIHASADFTDPHRIKPILGLTAETTMKGYAIRLSLEGEMDRFTLALSSDPPLEEVDILSLLTVGQLGKQTKGLEGGIGAGAATSFITGKQQDILEERIRALTGIDRFQVEPYVSKVTGTVQPRVTVSERFIGDKVFVTYTTSVGSTEEQVLRVEYVLNRNISLVGTRDDTGSIGGDVKFRFEFR